MDGDGIDEHPDRIGGEFRRGFDAFRGFRPIAEIVDLPPTGSDSLNCKMQRDRHDGRVGRFHRLRPQERLDAN